MKAIAIFLILSGTVLSIQAAPLKIGNCTVKDYNNKLRTCQTKFIKGLQQNPKDDCKVYHESFINCAAVAVQTCFPEVTVDFIRKAVKTQRTEDLMCKRAGLQFVDPLPTNTTLPCNITTSEYMAKNNECSDKMVKKWSANRADPTLCSEYRNVKECVKTIVNKYCQFKGDALEIINLQFDDYNPFCSTSKVSAKYSLTASNAAIVISLVVAVTQAF